MKSNTQLRQESLKKVISVIREKGPISKRELQRITGFSWGNISSTITLLCEEGIISCAGKQETGLGRRPEEFDINTEKDVKYRELLKRQASLCNSMKADILNHAQMTYFDVVNKSNKFLMRISCDFKALESACKSYKKDFKPRKKQELVASK